MTGPECPMCLEEVDELVSSEDDPEDLMCIECLEHFETESAYNEDLLRQAEEYDDEFDSNT